MQGNAKYIIQTSIGDITMLNKVIMQGNLTKDAECRTDNSGNHHLEFDIACNEKRKNETKPVYMRCHLWGGENLAQYLLMGRQVIVSGKIQVQTWDGQNGKQSRTLIEIDSYGGINFCGTRKQEGGRQSQNNNNGYSNQNSRNNSSQGGYSQSGNNNYANDDFEDDIPF